MENGKAGLIPNITRKMVGWDLCWAGVGVGGWGQVCIKAAAPRCGLHTRDIHQQLRITLAICANNRPLLRGESASYTMYIYQHRFNEKQLILCLLYAKLCAKDFIHIPVFFYLILTQSYKIDTIGSILRLIEIT